MEIGTENLLYIFNYLRMLKNDKKLIAFIFLLYFYFILCKRLDVPNKYSCK